MTEKVFAFLRSETHGRALNGLEIGQTRASFGPRNLEITLATMKARLRMESSGLDLRTMLNISLSLLYVNTRKIIDTSQWTSIMTARTTVY